MRSALSLRQRMHFATYLPGDNPAHRRRENADWPKDQREIPFPHEWLKACNEHITMKNIPTLKSRILKFALPVIGCLSLLGMTSCGTMHGFGHDVEHAGEEIKDAAR